MAAIGEVTSRSDRLVSSSVFLVVEFLPVETNLDSDAVEDLHFIVDDFLQPLDDSSGWRNEWDPQLVFLATPPGTLSLTLVFHPSEGSHILGGSIAAILSILTSQLSMGTGVLFRGELTELPTVAAVYWFLMTRSVSSRLGRVARSGRFTREELTTLPLAELEESDCDEDLLPRGGIFLLPTGEWTELDFTPEMQADQMARLFPV